MSHTVRLHKMSPLMIKKVCLQIAIHIEFYKGFDPIMQSSLRTKILASSFLMFPFSVKLKISIVLEKWTKYILCGRNIHVCI